jgi:hypothetical protein
MKHIQIYPYSRYQTEPIESISFNGMEQEDAEALALAFAHAPFHVSLHNTRDTCLKWVVNIKNEVSDGTVQASD